MDSETRYCIEVLADEVEENSNGGASYSGSVSVGKSRRLMPIIMDDLDISSEYLRVSSGRLQRKIHELILDSKKSPENPDSYVEDNLSTLEEELREQKMTIYQIAFPLNFHRKNQDLTPNCIRIADVEFEQLPRVEWEDRFMPDLGKDKLSHREQFFSRSLDKSPNDILESDFSYWFATYRARGQEYAINRVRDRLELFLSILNFSILYNKKQTISHKAGPWPDRWADVREPFVHLLHSEGRYLNTYWSKDATLRETNNPNLIHEERFSAVFEWFPSFGEETPLDDRLFSALREFQSAITNTDLRASFFEFWRGIEILTSVGGIENAVSVIERASTLLKWRDSKLAEMRLERARNKRNEYVHEGANLRITRADRNLVKNLLESLIDHYIDRRTEWSVEDMRFVFQNFSLQENKVKQLRRRRERELQLLDWIDSAREEYESR